MNLRRFPDGPSLNQALAATLHDQFTRRARHPRLVLLAGGRTPLDAYAATAAAGGNVADVLRLGLTDERLVPVTAPESNRGAIEARLMPLAIPETAWLNIDASLGLAAAADAYETALRGFFSTGGRLELVVLGLGADGHTASLFTEDDLSRGAGRLAVAVPRQPGPDRISVTPDLLARARKVLVVAAGAEKRDIVAKLMTSPESVIAGRALAAVKKVELWTDIA